MLQDLGDSEGCKNPTVSVLNLNTSPAGRKAIGRRLLGDIESAMRGLDLSAFEIGAIAALFVADDLTMIEDMEEEQRHQRSRVTPLNFAASFF
jgi:hypothetical protein